MIPIFLNFQMEHVPCCIGVILKLWYNIKEIGKYIEIYIRKVTELRQ